MDNEQLAEAKEYIERFKQIKTWNYNDFNLLMKLLYYMEKQQFKPVFLRRLRELENDLIYKCFFRIQILIVVIGFLVMLYFT